MKAMIMRASAPTLALLLFAGTMLPSGVLAIDAEQSAPDMCDDDNGWGRNDEFNLITEASPNRPADAAIAPIVPLAPVESSDEWNRTDEDNGTNDFRSEFGFESGRPIRVSGIMHYTYRVYECIDYTDLNSAGFFVYKYASNFVDDQGLWTMWEDDALLADEPERFMYSCDEANCNGQNTEPITREEMLAAAKAYASRWPTYETLSGHAVIPRTGTEFSGDYWASSDTANGFPTHKFTGCAVTLCVTAVAKPSLGPLL